jgi:hypothetical protein
MTVTSAGSVGINTTTPTTTLHVKDLGSGTQEVLRLDADAPYLAFFDDSDYLGFLYHTGTGGNLSIGNSQPGYTVLDGSLYIASNGDVSIGTSTPAAGYKLSVNGKAIAEEVKVQDSGVWPDYVFAEDYNLMPLTEVENHIKVNGHLPNIPSAAQIAEDEGVNLGEMNRLLLEKVEELTLHLIEADKRIQALEAQATTTNQ